MEYNYNYIFEYFKNKGYLLVDKKYSNTKNKMTIIDSLGYKYHISFDAFYWGEKKSNFVYEPEKFSKRNKYTYENIKLFISKNTDKFYLSGGEYASSQKKSLICTCNAFNHSWYATLDSIERGCGCPYCDGKIPSHENNLLDFFPEIVEDWDYKNNPLPPSEYTKYSGRMVFWRCKKGHSWKSTISNRTFIGNGCPICQESRGERIVRDFLINHSIEFIPQKGFDDLRGLDLGALHFDFCIYDKKNIFALIEFQGEQHFRPVDFFGGEDKFFKNRCHDIFKRYYCDNNNIKLIEISYIDIDNIEMILEKELFSLARKEAVLSE